MTSRTGADYLRMLKDRRVYVAGRLVSPTEDRSMNRMATWLADYLDACRTPSTLVGEDGVPHAYALATTAEQVRARGRAFADTARRSGGLMGRSPDFLATVLTGWRAAAGHFGPAAQRLVRYWERAREDNLVLTHAISDPPADRHLPGGGDPSTRAVRVVGETRDGLVVSGAKMLATLAPFADDLLVYPFRPLGAEESDQALCFSVPVGSPGLTLYCRPGLATSADGDQPLAERFDEIDAICLFDEVLVPWDRVFIDRDVTMANNLRTGTEMTAYAWHQSGARCWVKAEFVFEVAQTCAGVSGRARQQVVREQLGELAGIAETFRSLVLAAEAGARADGRGHVIPDRTPLAAIGMLNATLYPRAVELLQLVVSSGLVMHPQVADESPGSPTSPFFQRYFSGAGATGAEHGQLLRAAADLALDRFGGRQVLYERVFLGPPDAFRAKFYDQYVDQRGVAGMLPEILAR
jgi:aromatic ring hydroxylase